MAVIAEHRDRYAADHDITQHAQPVRYLAEHEKAEDCGEQHLRIIKYRNLLGRGVQIGERHAELAERCRRARAHQTHELGERHRVEVRNNERQRRERGKRREKEHDARAFLLPLAQRADKGIRRTGAHAAEQTDDRRKGVRREAGLDDEHRAAERREHGEILPDIRAFLEQEKREQDRENGDILLRMFASARTRWSMA